jgi:hypothetical protein
MGSIGGATANARDPLFFAPRRFDPDVFGVLEVRTPYCYHAVCACPTFLRPMRRR